MAFWLRDLRRRADLTYEQLAVKTGYSVSTLQEACAGRRLPTLRVTTAFAQVCGGDQEAWSSFWAAAWRLVDQPTGEPLPAPPWAAAPPSQPPLPAQGQDELADGAGAGGVDSLPVSASFMSGPRRRARVRWVWATGVLVVCAVVAVLAVAPWRAPRSAAATGWTEVEFNRHGAPTFQDVHELAGREPVIPFKATVSVSCKVLSPSIASVSPDGYWYRIATAPWTGLWAAANTFGNGDTISGPYTHNTDWRIPNC